MAKYRTKDQDTVDLICWKFYGNTNPGTIEGVYEANRHLAKRGAVLPSGLLIELPAIQVKPLETVRLWK